MARAARKLKSVPKPAGFAEEAQPFVHDDIVHGIEAKRVQELIDRGVLGAKQVYRVIPERTFKRRLANREVLKVSEGDAIARFLRLTEMATKIFGDSDFAGKWMVLPNPALKNRIPIELAETDSGAREVEAALTHIAYGDYI
jgi:putative toxin-antitoxin system antitoxin component (TIGR02293 family)